MPRPDPKQLDELLAGRMDALCVGGAAARSHAGRIVFPGSFNPLHEGHRRMADTASRLIGQPVEFEISVYNVDKPPLQSQEVLVRLEQFAPQERIWLTRAATFLEKSQQFAGATFVTGIDTLIRVADARYFDDCERRCAAAIDEIAELGCRFLVFGRIVDDRFQTLSDLQLPAVLRDLCREVAESEFRADISSTEIRRDPQ